MTIKSLLYTLQVYNEKYYPKLIIVLVMTSYWLTHLKYTEKPNSKIIMFSRCIFYCEISYSM